VFTLQLIRTGPHVFGATAHRTHNSCIYHTCGFLGEMPHGCANNLLVCHCIRKPRNGNSFACHSYAIAPKLPGNCANNSFASHTCRPATCNSSICHTYENWGGVATRNSSVLQASGTADRLQIGTKPCHSQPHSRFCGTIIWSTGSRLRVTDYRRAVMLKKNLTHGTPNHSRS
jgi:hypothetical protein